MQRLFIALEVNTHAAVIYSTGQLRVHMHWLFIELGLRSIHMHALTDVCMEVIQEILIRHKLQYIIPSRHNIVIEYTSFNVNMIQPWVG